jgi:aspartyl-tRNA(Asn)/glutamyl-tRNA(Gln) amidotransferase subunit C
MEIKDVENLAELARIELSEDEKRAILKDMEGILDYVKQVESVNFEDKKTSYDLYNVWREDKEETREFSEKLIKDQFPASQDGFVKVKKVM